MTFCDIDHLALSKDVEYLKKIPMLDQWCYMLSIAIA